MCDNNFILDMQDQQTEQNTKIESFTSCYTRDDSAQLKNLKLEFCKKHNIDEKSQMYFVYSDFKLLCCYLFFSLAPVEKHRQKKIQTVMKQMEDKQSKDNPSMYIEICKKKFPLNWTPKSLTSTVQNKENLIYINRIPLQKVSQNLNRQQCEQLLRSGLADLPLAVQLNIDGQQTNIVNKKNVNDGIVIYKDKNWKYYVLAFYSSKQSQIKLSMEEKRKSRESIPSSNDDDSQTRQIQIQSKKFKQQQIQPQQKQKQKPKQKSKSQHKKSQKPQSTNVSNSQIKKSSSIPAKLQQLPQQSQKKQSKIKKSYSENNKEEAEAKSVEQKINEMTWFQTTVIVIIFFIILSEFVHIFDPFLHKYNQNLGGRYYLLQGGYKLGRFLFGKNSTELL